MNLQRYIACEDGASFIWGASECTKNHDQTENHRLEAGGFKRFVSYGLKSFAHEGVTRKLSSPSLGSVPSCPRMYAAIASSVTFPLDATK